MYYVYILELSDKSHYVGYSENLKLAFYCAFNDKWRKSTSPDGKAFIAQVLSSAGQHNDQIAREIAAEKKLH